jgi:valyl-tRNA synthetase
MKLLHPFMPFITEEVLAIISAHCGLKLEDSLVRAAWPKMHPLKINAESLENFCALLESIKELRNIKADLGIAQKKVKLEIQASSYVGNLWTAHQAWIKRLGFFESIELKKQLKRVLYKNDLWEINLDIADIDESSFIASLTKKINNLKSVFEKSESRLKNENFLKNAAPQTVEEEKIKFNELALQLKRLKELENAFRP